jgi:aminoglycoside phosphotransferase (APT) family kinase protein
VRDASLPTDTQFRQPAAIVEQPWPQLASYLASQRMRLDPMPPRQFAGGLANLNYLVHIDGRPAVLRRPPAGPSAEGANDMAREWRVLSRLHAGYPLAPRGLHFCADHTVLGCDFQIIEYRAGHAVGGTLPIAIRERDDVGDQLTDALLDAMITLHTIDPQAVGLDDLGRPDVFVERQIEGWIRRATAVFPTPPAEVDAIGSWLRAGPRPSSRAALVHNDFKFDNMLIDLDTLTPVAVVDWDMATRGDPLFDLAVLLSYWVERGDPPRLHTLNQVPSLRPGFPSRGEVARRYLTRTGHDETDLRFLLTLARFRLAIAWMQLFRLFERGAVRDPAYASFAAMASSILQWTADTLAEPPL